MQDVYKNIDEYSPGGKRKILVVFNCMIADMISNRKSNQIVTEIYTRRIKTKHFYCFYWTILFYNTKRY